MDKCNIIKLHESGKSLRQIAKICDISYERVRQILKQNEFREYEDYRSLPKDMPKYLITDEMYQKIVDNKRDSFLYINTHILKRSPDYISRSYREHVKIKEELLRRLEKYLGVKLI